MHAVDYCDIKTIREYNFEYLHEKLRGLNKLTLKTAAFMYPLLIDGGSRVRKLLIEKQIYIPILWPAVKRITDQTDLEYRFAEDILPIPIDQRYGTEEMDIIVNEIMDIMEA